jgi:hypothetical protein
MPKSPKFKTCDWESELGAKKLAAWTNICFRCQRTALGKDVCICRASPYIGTHVAQQKIQASGSRDLIKDFFPRPGFYRDY